MIVTENWCVDCGLHCIGKACPNVNVKVHYCDRCGVALSEWEIYDSLDEDEELCESCRSRKGGDEDDD